MGWHGPQNPRKDCTCCECDCNCVKRCEDGTLIDIKGVVLELNLSDTLVFGDDFIIEGASALNGTYLFTQQQNNFFSTDPADLCSFSHSFIIDDIELKINNTFHADVALSDLASSFNAAISPGYNTYNVTAISHRFKIVVSNYRINEIYKDLTILINPSNVSDNHIACGETFNFDMRAVKRETITQSIAADRSGNYSGEIYAKTILEGESFGNVDFNTDSMMFAKTKEKGKHFKCCNGEQLTYMQTNGLEVNWSDDYLVERIVEGEAVLYVRDLVNRPGVYRPATYTIFHDYRKVEKYYINMTALNGTYPLSFLPAAPPITDTEDLSVFLNNVLQNSGENFRCNSYIYNYSPFFFGPTFDFPFNYRNYISTYVENSLSWSGYDTYEYESGSWGLISSNNTPYEEPFSTCQTNLYSEHPLHLSAVRLLIPPFFPDFCDFSPSTFISENTEDFILPKPPVSSLELLDSLLFFNLNPHLLGLGCKSNNRNFYRAVLSFPAVDEDYYTQSYDGPAFDGDVYVGAGTINLTAGHLTISTQMRLPTGEYKINFNEMSYDQ